jgi:hypothetical protein
VPRQSLTMKTVTVSAVLDALLSEKMPLNLFTIKPFDSLIL